MKKMFLSVAIALATFGVLNAKNYEKMNYEQKELKIETIEDVIQANDSTPYIIKFYDIERLKIKNDSNALIRVYNEKWKLILETNGDVNKTLIGGSYYVACNRKLKSLYVESN